MNIRPYRKNSRDRGVALLFALGILSLLLVLGLAFVTHAVIARKAAYNNSSRSQAKILAQSAINRIASSVMLYQINTTRINHDNSISAGDNDIRLTDFSTVVSYDTVASPTTVTDGGTPQTNISDQLDAKLPPPSRIDAPSTPDTYYSDLENAETERRPRWIFADNGRTGNDKRLIGRFAYRVLPPESDSAISLPYWLRGDFTLAGKPFYSDINFLPTSGTPLRYWNGGDAGSIVISTDPGKEFIASMDTFLIAWNSRLGTAAQKDWVRKWFTDSPLPGELEIYRSMGGDGGNKVRDFHRFNLSRTDWGTAPPATSLNGLAANSDLAVEALMANSHHFKHNTSAAGDAFDMLALDADSPLNSGLPFLNLIAQNGATFGSTPAGLIARRKQIAANLIDYSDADNVPTSDVAAGSWANPALSPLPTYTGNEKTPYINEVALGFKLVPTADNATGVLTSTLTPELLAELIDIYGGATNAYTLKTSVSNLQLNAEISIAAEIKYEKTSIADGTTSEHSLEVKDILQTVTMPAAPTAAEAISLDFSAGNAFSNGYLLWAGSLADIASDNDFMTDLKAKVPNDPGFTNTFKSATIKAVQYKINSLKFNLAPLVLTDNNNGNSGVDFVRWDAAHELTAQGVPFNPFTQNANAYVSAAPTNITQTDGYLPLDTTGFIQTGNQNSYRFYVGGMETVDPRQNLNVSFDTLDPHVTDWIISPTLTSFKNDATKKVLSMTISEEPLTKDRLRQAERNNATDASTPDAAYFTPGNYDVETSADPANGTLSTAYIRNAPMLSVWELGAIHRGAAWETVNLKNAASPTDANTPFRPEDHEGVTGTGYAGGDGAILDQVKLLPDARTYGKINLNMLKKPTYVSNDLQLFQALLDGITLTGNYTDPGADTGTVLPVNGAQQLHTLFNTGTEFQNRAQAIYHAAGANGLYNLNGTLMTLTNDARQEELIGKIMNLLKVTPAEVTTFKADIVAQAIRDADGRVTRVKKDGTTLETQDCAFGQFDMKTDATDPDDNVYFDEITGEIKMRVTFDRNPATGQIKVRQLEYLD